MILYLKEQIEEIKFNVLRKHKVLKNNKVTITNTRNKRIHKNKIKRSFQADGIAESTVGNH